MPCHPDQAGRQGEDSCEDENTTERPREAAGSDQEENRRAVAEIQKVQQEMNKEGLTPQQEKALTDKYWQLCEENGKDFHDMVHFFDNYGIP